MIPVFVVITLLYVILLLMLNTGLIKIKVFKGLQTDRFESFSVVIPFRNETDRLDDLIKSLARLQYPKDRFEIIFVDDHSTDDSVEKINDFIKSHQEISIRSFKLSEENRGKKKALEVGIENALNSWILCTDADCEVNEKWIDIFNQFIQSSKPDMVVAPVNYTKPKNSLEMFQLMDLSSLQFATAGGFGIGLPFLSNGANLAFKRSIFNEVGGYSGHEGIASGDDVFLLHAFISKKKKVKYLRNSKAIVVTPPEEGVNALLNQRRRWAAKASAYKNPFATISALLVGLMNLSLVIGIVIGVFNPEIWSVLPQLFFIKFVVDGMGIMAMLVFFDRFETIPHYIWSAFIYPFFSSYIAISSLFYSYSWKDRIHKK